ncbi:MAG: iron-containing redox enzyme family protein, partial [Brevundimonas sp.]
MFAAANAGHRLDDHADPAAFHRRLAQWNNRRLSPSTPSPDWMAHAQEDAEMTLLEGGFVERQREAVAHLLHDLPDDVEGFIAWFEALKGGGPGENDPLFPWLAEAASLEDMRWFLLQEVAGEAGFEDLVAMAQVKMPTRPKLELARNYWDEMGRGNEGGMHGPMLERTCEGLSLAPTIDGTAWQSLALANTMTAFATTRRYAYHSVGALG